MEVVTRYKAADGREFQSRDECIKRDELIKEVNTIMGSLKPTPDKLNWEGYVQQDKQTVLSVRSSLYRIANRPGVLADWIKSQKMDHGKTDGDLVNAHPSWFGRMLDGGHEPLGDAYSRLCCIDSENREWNQPYYAMNTTADRTMICVG